MHYISTRNSTIKHALSTAILTGLAPDGGLYVPEYLPFIKYEKIDSSVPFAEFVAQILSLYFKNDKLNSFLNLICEQALNFEVPLKPINQNTFLLELFHGPTLSFKDFGARFLAECLAQISNRRPLTIMVATSGDTGSAVASAFDGKDNIKVIILYPKGQVSKRQEHQMTCWGENILALAVEGDFDTCQKLVKTAFEDQWWKKNHQLTSSNSINIARLLPQISYYAYTSSQFFQSHGKKPGFIVPTGNLGNATAAYWAKMMGFPIRDIVLSTNANRTIVNYLETGNYQAQPSISTLANAMDVGNPSNFERLSYLFHNPELFKNNVKAISVSDQQITQTIKEVYSNNNLIICPHTATAYFARKQLSSDEPWIVVSTADPSKFDSIIEPIIGAPLTVNSQLQQLLDKPTQKLIVGPSLIEIQKYL